MNCYDDRLDKAHGAIRDWLDKYRPSYNPYPSIINYNLGSDMRLLFGDCKPIGKKNAKCIDFNRVDEITYENGGITVHYGFGRMNIKNLKRLKKYLESKNLTVCGVWNETVFGVNVIRIVFEDCSHVNEGNLAHVLQVSEKNVHDVTGDMFYVMTSALCKHINDVGVLEIEKPFDLMDYEFKKQFSTLNPILCQLRKNGIRIDTIDIWEDYLMIKSDCPRGALTMQSIRKALNIGETTEVICIQGNRWYAVVRWK